MNAPGFVSSSKFKQFTTKSGEQIRIIAVPKLNLYFIVDIDNIGPHWYRVTHRDGLFTTEYLFGGAEETYGPIARFFSEAILGKSMESTPPDRLRADSLVLSISLRKQDREMVKEIAEELKNIIAIP